jgi:hypothetical protein
VVNYNEQSREDTRKKKKKEKQTRGVDRFAGGSGMITLILTSGR